MRHDLDPRAKCRRDGGDGPKLGIDLGREEPPYHRVVATDLTSQFSLRKTGLNTKGIERPHHLVDLRELLAGLALVGASDLVFRPIVPTVVRSLYADECHQVRVT